MLYAVRTLMREAKKTKVCWPVLREAKSLFRSALLRTNFCSPSSLPTQQVLRRLAPRMNSTTQHPRAFITHQQIDKETEIRKGLEVKKAPRMTTPNMVYPLPFCLRSKAVPRTKDVHTSHDYATSAPPFTALSSTIYLHLAHLPIRTGTSWSTSSCVASHLFVIASDLPHDIVESIIDTYARFGRGLNELASERPS